MEAENRSVASQDVVVASGDHDFPGETPVELGSKLLTNSEEKPLALSGEARDSKDIKSDDSENPDREFLQKENNLIDNVNQQEEHMRDYNVLGKNDPNTQPGQFADLLASESKSSELQDDLGPLCVSDTGDLGLESVSTDESNPCKTVLSAAAATTNYTDIQSPVGLPNNSIIEATSGVNDKTDIQSPDSNLSPGDLPNDKIIETTAAGVDSNTSFPSSEGRSSPTKLGVNSTEEAGFVGANDYDTQFSECGFLTTDQSVKGSVYTDIHSPEGNSSPPGPADDQTRSSGPDNYGYTNIQSPDDREDISDAELELPAEAAKGDSTEQIPKGTLDLNQSEARVVSETDAIGELILLKPDDAVKSDAGSTADDVSRVSRVPSEDLEAVSEDELPEVSHTKTVAVVEGGEDVSSEDEEVENAASSANISKRIEGMNSSCKSSLPPGVHEPVSPTALPEPVSHRGLPEPVSPDLAPLDAEPISDEEENCGLAEEEDAEAGEIQSPTEDITSPPSSPEQSGANLGEVEPVSPDDSNDTDGELPSCDDDSEQPGDAHLKTGANFESIESEEEGDVGVAASLKGSVMVTKTEMFKKIDSDRKADGYMESISDEENLDTGSDKLVDVSSKNVSTVTEIKAKSECSKKVAAPNFNEHQVELDYEETEGDDGEMKPQDEDKIKLQLDESKNQEAGQCGASDKDEGELSDDDCEEGEIKEPGSRKPFMKPMCRFFQRGNCTWGVNCRFLHPGVNDKGNYQMIEIPGFQPTGVHARLGVPGSWPEQAPPVEEIEIPPPPLRDTPPPETAWERGLRIAKEQRKKATERKEQEPDFEEKRLHLSVDEERELNKENERVPRIIPKDPYYDQQAFEEDEYYKISRDPWQTGHYENFEVRYNREHSYSPPPYREKQAMPAPPVRYNRPYSSPPPVDKFGRDRPERREDHRPKAVPPGPAVNDYPSSPRRPDEWVDPWRRQTTRKSSKSPTRAKHKSDSRGRRGRRSVSDSSNSSRSVSGSSSRSSRSSRSYSGSGSSHTSSRSRSGEPAPPGVDRHDRYQSPSRDQPRSAVSVSVSMRGGRGRGGPHHNSYDPGYRREQPAYGRSRGGGGGGGGAIRGDGGFHNRSAARGGGPGGTALTRDRGRPRIHSPPDRPLPYVRPRARSASSRSSSSGSRSRSRSRSRPGRQVVRGRGSSSRSSSGSSSSRSSSSSSAGTGSADSQHLYRDLGSPGKSPSQGGATGITGASASKKRAGANSYKERGMVPGRGMAGGTLPPPPPGPQRHLGPSAAPGGSQQHRNHINLEHIPIPRDPREPRDGRSARDMRDSRDSRDLRASREAGLPATGTSSGGRSESRYASRNAPQAPIKAKDPLKVVGQKSNIKLTLLPKQQQSSLGSRPNPLDSPPRKRRISDRDPSPPSAPPAKRLNLPVPQASALRVAQEKAAKLQEKGRLSPHHSSMTGSTSGLPSSSSGNRARAPPSSSGTKSRGPETSLAKTAAKLAPSSSGAAGTGASGAGFAPGPAAGAGGKAKKSMSSRREELLKQLKAVEDAIARKKTKLP